jgi:ribonuclease BN (tRNA processing enzyme)
MKLTIVGSGDAFGSGGRFNTCFKVETAGRTVLIDFGASSLVALKAQGIDPNTIDGILISHLHGDHFGGLPFLLLDAQFLSRRTRPLVIAGPPGSRARIDALMEIFFPRSTGTKWRFAWNVVELAPGPAHEWLGFKVTTAEVVHPSGAPSTAIRLDDGSSVVAYSGDTEWTDALIPIADGADLFIIECYEHDREVAGHLCWGILKTRLADLRARRIVVTHMNPSMLACIREASGLGLLIAKDGLALEL